MTVRPAGFQPHPWKQFGGRQKNRRTSFVYTYFEAFVLLLAALAPFTSFAARAAPPLADYQRWNS